MVGGHLCSRLRQLEEITLLSPLRKELNLLNYNDVELYIREQKPDCIVHAAGIVGGIQANISEPVNYLVGNLDMGRNLVLAAMNCGVNKFLNISSSCIYPRNRNEPLNEKDLLTGELEPTNEGYALAKIVILKLCQFIHRSNRALQYKTLIPCNLYGPNDKFDPNRSHLIPAIIHKLHQAKRLGQPAVEIWGDGNARREFMFVDDLIDCILLAITNIENFPDIMNVGVGKDKSINDYYAIASQVVGYDGDTTHDLSKPVGMKRKLLDVSSVNNLGWTAKTSLETGMKYTYEYYKKTVGA